MGIDAGYRIDVWTDSTTGSRLLASQNSREALPPMSLIGRKSMYSNGSDSTPMASLLARASRSGSSTESRGYHHSYDLGGIVLVKSHGFQQRKHRISYHYKLPESILYPLLQNLAAIPVIAGRLMSEPRVATVSHSNMLVSAVLSRGWSDVVSQRQIEAHNWSET